MYSYGYEYLNNEVQSFPLAQHSVFARVKERKEGEQLPVFSYSSS